MMLNIVLPKTIDGLDDVKMVFEWRACGNDRFPCIDRPAMFSFLFPVAEIRVHEQNFSRNQSVFLQCRMIRTHKDIWGDVSWEQEPIFAA